MSLEEGQYVYDLWIDKSIPSVNFMNGRDSIKIRYEKYDWHYCKLNNEKHPVQEKANHGVKVYVALQSHHVHYLDIKVKKFC